MAQPPAHTLAVTTDPTSVSERTQWANFRKLWFGQGVSQLGTAVTAVALPLLAVLKLDAGALEVAIITGAEYAAYTLLGFVAGVYVDRRMRRQVMLLADAGRAVAVALVPVLYGLGLLRIWHLYVVALVVGILSLLFEAAHAAYLPALISRDKLIAGNARLQGTTSAMQLGGRGVAGVLVSFVGAATTLLVDTLSYVVSFFSILSIRGVTETHLDRAPSEEAPRETVRAQVVEGFRYLRTDPILVGFLGCIAQFNFFLVAEEALFVVFLVKSVHASPGVVGVMLAAEGTGALVGAVVARGLARRLGTGKAMVLGTTLGPLLGILIPVTSGTTTLWCFAIGAGGLGATTTILKVVGGSYRQATVPPHLLGRMVSTMRTVTWGPIPLGALIGGVLGQTLGPRLALLVLSLLLLAAPIWLVASPIWKLDESEQEEDAARIRA